jgi:hypothetical protein
MRARQRLLRALVVDIIADIDDKAREIVLTMPRSFCPCRSGVRAGDSA